MSRSSVTQYRRKMRCKFQVIIAFFSKTVCPKNMKFGLLRVSIWVNIQKNFNFLGRTVSEKNAMLTCKISKLFIRENCNFEFLQVIIAFFSKTVWPRNMKFGLHRVSVWVNIQKKFQVPRSHSIGEKLFFSKTVWLMIIKFGLHRVSVITLLVKASQLELVKSKRCLLEQRTRVFIQKG